MGELRYVEQVGDQAAHHFAGVVLIVIREAEALVLVEQVGTHIGLHARAHDMAPAGDEPLAARTQQIQGDHADADQAERAHHHGCGLQEEIAREEVEQLGKCQVDAGEKRGAYQIEPEQELVLAVIADEFLEHLSARDGRIGGFARLAGGDGGHDVPFCACARLRVYREIMIGRRARSRFAVRRTRKGRNPHVRIPPRTRS